MQPNKCSHVLVILVLGPIVSVASPLLASLLEVPENRVLARFLSIRSFFFRNRCRWCSPPPLTTSPMQATKNSIRGSSLWSHRWSHRSTLGRIHRMVMWTTMLPYPVYRIQRRWGCHPLPCWVGVFQPCPFQKTYMRQLTRHPHVSYESSIAYEGTTTSLNHYAIKHHNSWQFGPQASSTTFHHYWSGAYPHHTSSQGTPLDFFLVFRRVCALIGNHGS